MGKEFPKCSECGEQMLPTMNEFECKPCEIKVSETTDLSTLAIHSVYRDYKGALCGKDVYIDASEILAISFDGVREEDCLRDSILEDGTRRYIRIGITTKQNLSEISFVVDKNYQDMIELVTFFKRRSMNK